MSERFSVAPLAFAPDGRTVGFAGPLDRGVEIARIGARQTPEGGGDVAATWGNVSVIGRTLP